MANELVTLILNENVKSRTNRATETTRFIEGETDKRRAELVGIEAKISQFKLENDAALPEKLGFVMSRLESARNNLANLDKEIQGTEEQERLLEFELSVRSAANNSASGLDPSQLPVANQLEALKTALARKRSMYTDSHPDVRALKEQIAALQAQDAQASSAVVEKKDATNADSQKLNLNVRLVLEKIDAIKARRAFMQKQRVGVVKSIEALNKIIAQVPEVQSQLSNLERHHDVLQKQLDDLAGKLNEARLGEKMEKDQQGERFEVIEQPIVPTDPIKPQRPMILLGGIGVAGGAAFGLALLLELFNRTVHSATDILRVLGQPPLATIPYFTTAAERRRNRIRIALGSLTAVMSIAAVLAAIHFLYMPLDLVFYKVLNRFQV